MTITIDIDQIAGEIAKELSKYGREVIEKVNLSSEKVGKAAVKQLKRTSPRRPPPVGGGYAKGWTLATEKEFGQPYRRIVHNKSKPHLTHLLEHGHAKVGGGRVEGKPHIRPVEEMVIQEFVKEVEEAIQRG